MVVKSGKNMSHIQLWLEKHVISGRPARVYEYIAQTLVAKGCPQSVVISPHGTMKHPNEVSEKNLGLAARWQQYLGDLRRT